MLSATTYFWPSGQVHSPPHVPVPGAFSSTTLAAHGESKATIHKPTCRILRMTAGSPPTHTKSLLYQHTPRATTEGCVCVCGNGRRGIKNRIFSSVVCATHAAVVGHDLSLQPYGLYILRRRSSNTRAPLTWHPTHTHTNIHTRSLWVPLRSRQQSCPCSSSSSSSPCWCLGPWPCRQ